MEIFGNLLSILDAEGNFSNYRDHLRTTSPPCVPYLGMHLASKYHLNFHLLPFPRVVFD
ncbi:MAG: RasGEF domain-containing protein [Myxococcales bacterium]